MIELVLVRGMPGSGKSTLAKSPRFAGYMKFEADMYFIDPVTRQYNFDPSKLYQAHKWCQRQTKDCLNNGISVVVSNTFTTRKEMKDYYDIAEEVGVPIRIIKVIGNFQNVHGVPEEVLQKMRDRWQDVDGEEVVDNRDISDA